MPTWGDILTEIMALVPRDPKAFDDVRRKYLTSLHGHVGRDVILYATSFTSALPPGAPANITSITDEDLQGFMEAVNGLKSKKLDLILHSPGGSAETAEAIVSYLRSKFDDIRVIVPSLAMSAATMLACAADVVLMGNHSFLGPIDPQMLITTPLGQRMAPAQAILDQFDQALAECQDPAKLRAWLPMLGQYGPDLLVQCKNASEKSQELVETWLKQYMFAKDKDGPKKAKAIASWLGSHQHFKSHGRHISRDELTAKGLNVSPLESNHKTQDLVLSVFHATMILFNTNSIVKIVENHLGKAWMKRVAPPQMMMPQMILQGPLQPGQPGPPGQPGGPPLPMPPNNP
ncbi:MAG TPA: ATP-dependent Clp protease proteolytic subunit [Chthonomonadaceae bacterium]|nr:ATP-dependent Clp protease proteolytic subunit [Chthonomonadaceae bacterium]